MTPADYEARRRLTLLSLSRATGVILMLLGMWAWHGNVIRSGGWPELGIPLFVCGLIASFIVPHVLMRRWRSPRP